jgi:hypothetical protein
MSEHTDVYAIIANLVNEWPSEAAPDSEALRAARRWLEAHNAHDPRPLAQETLASLDALLRALQGGAAFDALLNAREMLAGYIHHAPIRSDALNVKLAPSGGVTLVRNGQHFTIDDAELEAVRDAINERKREVRKLQRRGRA